MTPVAAPHIPAHWARLWGLLEPAVTHGGEHTEGSVLTALLHGGMVLWIDAERIEDAHAAVVTAWCDYPAGRIGYVQFAGGTDARLWTDDAVRVLMTWAQSMGCKELRLIGRKGWGRLLGMTPAAYTYARSL